MAKNSTLELLAPEIQLKILLNAGSPSDLHAFVRASPRLYQVFLLNKDSVLSNVARRQFHPSVISDALSVAKISQLEKPLTRETVVELCEAYPIGLLDEPTTSIPSSTTLCELASNVKFLIKDYARNTLPIMEGLGRSLDLDILAEYSPNDSATHSTLSDSETGRLQRAFCRFENYRLLFARCSPDLDHKVQTCPTVPPLPPAGQASLFLEKFSDFQITEIICIRDYLYRRLRGICSRLEDEAADTLSAESFVFDQDDDVEGAEWRSGVYLFTRSGKYYQDQHIEHLMSLGLGYIRRLFESTGEEQKNLFVRYVADPSDMVGHLEMQFITRAFEFLGRNPALGDTSPLAETDPPFVYEVNADVELDIPDAWQWAHPDGPPFSVTDVALKGLRDWGYVFWDSNRLRESGILERSVEDVQIIEFDEYEAARTPSVQERLLGPSSPLEDYDPASDTIVEDDPGYDSLMDDSPGDDSPGDDSSVDNDPGDGNPGQDSHVVEKPEDDSPEDTTITLKTIALRVIAVVGQTLRNVVSPREDSHE